MKATATPLPILLVVDDDELVLDGLEATFEDDFQVLTAGSAERARELVAQHTIDIVISDDRLPQETGVSFLGWLAEVQPTAVRILLTGFFSEPGDVRRAIGQGRMWHYMRKPWEAGSMENIVNRALESRQLAQGLKAAEERYRSLYAFVRCPLFTATLDGKGLTWNAAFSELLQDWPEGGLNVAERLPAGAWTSLVDQLQGEGEESSSEVVLQGAGVGFSAKLSLRREGADEVTGAVSLVGGMVATPNPARDASVAAQIAAVCTQLQRLQPKLALRVDMEAGEARIQLSTGELSVVLSSLVLSAWDPAEPHALRLRVHRSGPHLEICIDPVRENALTSPMRRSLEALAQANRGYLRLDPEALSLGLPLEEAEDQDLPPAVLLLESDTGQRRLLQRALSRDGLRVLEAGGLPEALAIVGRSAVVAIVTQGDVEHARGLEALLSRLPEQRLLLCTPDVDHPAVQALSTRGVALLAMPYSLGALKDAVKALMPE